MWRDRSRPYGVRRVHENEQRNPEAGPSTSVTLPDLYVDPTGSQPPRGISETTADAENDLSSSEEGEASVSDVYCSQIPHVAERSSSTSGGQPDQAATQPKTRRLRTLDEGRIRQHGVQLGAPSNGTRENPLLQRGPEK